jgi:hypothetical protein
MFTRAPQLTSAPGGFSNRNDGNEIVPSKLHVHCPERYLSQKPHHIVNVIVSVIISARPIQQGVMSQSLGVM